MQTSASDHTLHNLRRRLERWELDHLRKLAGELQDRLDRALLEVENAKDDRDRAWGAAESWQRHAQDLQQVLWEAGGEVGLTQDGELVVAGPAESDLQTQRDELLASLRETLEISGQVMDAEKLTRPEQQAFADARALIDRIGA